MSLEEANHRYLRILLQILVINDTEASKKSVLNTISVPQTKTEQQGKHFRENAPSGGEESSFQIRKGRSKNKEGTTNDARKERTENMRKVRLRNFGIVKEGRSNQEHEDGAIVETRRSHIQALIDTHKARWSR